MVPSLALGTGEVTLMELTASYGAFANRGRVAEPRLITHVTDAHGQTIWRAPQVSVQALSETTACLMSSMLADVVSSGTATGVRAAGFRLPAAGKTGTTDDYADAWFIGYTPSLVAGVWFGMDVPAPIMSGGFAGIVGSGMGELHAGRDEGRARRVVRRAAGRRAHCDLPPLRSPRNRGLPSS